MIEAFFKFVMSMDSPLKYDSFDDLCKGSWLCSGENGSTMRHLAEKVADM